MMVVVKLFNSAIVTVLVVVVVKVVMVYQVVLWSCIGSRNVTVNTTGSDGQRRIQQSATLIALIAGGSVVRGGDGGNWGEDGNGPVMENDTGGDGGFVSVEGVYGLSGTQNTDTFRLIPSK